MVEVVLGPEVDLVVVHGLLCLFSEILDCVFAGLEAVQAVCALGLFEKDVFWAELFVFDVR